MFHLIAILQMKLKLIFILIILLGNYCQLVYSFWLIEMIKGLWTAFDAASKVNIKQIEMQPGDVIWCRIGPSFSPFWHFFLASSSLTVIHLDGVSNLIEEVDTETLINRLDGEKSTKAVDNCENHGAGSRGRNESIQLARQFVNRTVHYNFFWCNCQHWVSFWADGSPHSFNTGLSINEKCFKDMFPMNETSKANSTK